MEAGAAGTVKELHFLSSSFSAKVRMRPTASASCAALAVSKAS